MLLSEEENKFGFFLRRFVNVIKIQAPIIPDFEHIHVLIISKVERNIGSYHISRFLESAFVLSQKIVVVCGWVWEGSGKMEFLLLLVP